MLSWILWKWLQGPELQEIIDNSTLEINFLSDLEDLIANEDVVLTLSPNPTVDFANISLEGDSLNGTYQLTVYDAAGKEVYKTSQKAYSKQMNFEVDVNDFTSGYYFYNIQGTSKSYKGTFIKN